MGLLEAWKFIRKQCGSAISMRGWRGEYWLVDAMRAPEKLEHICTPNLDMIFFTSPCFPVFRQHAVNDMFLFETMWNHERLAKSCQGRIEVYFSTFLLPSHLFDFSGFRFFGVSSSLSTLNSLTLVLLAANVRKGTRQKLKKSKSEKSKSVLFAFSTFRLFDFLAFLLPSRLSTL